MPPNIIVGPILNFCNRKKNEEGESFWIVSAMVATDSPAAPELELFVAPADDQDAELHPLKPPQPRFIEEVFQHFFYGFEMVIRQQPYEQVVLYSFSGTRQRQFFVPGTQQNLRFIFHTCNEYDDDKNKFKYGGIRSNWIEIMEEQSATPWRKSPRASGLHYHFMIGGGDQLYCDTVFTLDSIKKWLDLADDPQIFIKQRFTRKMRLDATRYYFYRYMSHFTTPDFDVAVGSIPSVNTWDDHDIFNGWGSYMPDLLNCSVMRGIFSCARRFYLLFQHQVSITENNSPRHHELFHVPGKFGSSWFKNLGTIAILGPDVRTERTVHQFVSKENWDFMFAKLDRELDPAICKHLLVVLTVPIVYPSINLPYKIAHSMSPFRVFEERSVETYKPRLIDKMTKAANLRTPLGTFFLLDDMLDQWSVEPHFQERNMVLTRLSEFSKKKGIRVTILSGDVHLCAAGCLTRKGNLAHKVPYSSTLTDPTFMLQLVSSPMGNIPSPKGLRQGLRMVSRACTFKYGPLEGMMINWHEVNDPLRVPQEDAPNEDYHYDRISISKRHPCCFKGKRNWLVIQEQTTTTTTTTGGGMPVSTTLFAELHVETRNKKERRADMSGTPPPPESIQNVTHITSKVYSLVVPPLFIRPQAHQV